MTVYDFVYASALGATAPVWLLAPKLRRKVLDALLARNGQVPAGDASRPAVLIHAVSMGEINATTSLVKMLSEAQPRLRFIISTTSRTGEARANELYEKNPLVTRIRFPFDFSRFVSRMLDAQRPVAAVLMELEVWPNFISECGRREIPVLLVNGRLSAHSFRNYKFAGPLARAMFKRLTMACVQEEAYADRFRRVGVLAENVRITGTMKFDTAQLAGHIDGADEIADNVGLRIGEEKIWICGSSGPGEEEIILIAFKELIKTFPTLRLVIVPRHPERFDEVAELIRGHGFTVVRRSHAKLQKVNPTSPSAAGSPVILGDTMGELRKFYSLADVVFVGRTLVDLGPKQHGSDMIEPAALAKPVIVGPFTGNFTEVMNRFREADAMREVRDGSGLQQAVASLLGSSDASREMGARAQEVVRKNQGATAHHVEIILSHLKRSYLNLVPSPGTPGEG